MSTLTQDQSQGIGQQEGFKSNNIAARVGSLGGKKPRKNKTLKKN